MFSEELKQISDEIERSKRAKIGYYGEEYKDVRPIHTQGLAEGIMCAMCTNIMKSDMGCDGGCCVNKSMYKKVMDVIDKHMM